MVVSAGGRLAYGGLHGSGLDAAEAERPLADHSLVCFECYAAGATDTGCNYCFGTGRIEGFPAQQAWAKREQPTNTQHPLSATAFGHGPLHGYAFAATGKMKGYTRETLEDDIDANGGRLHASVTKKVDFLIVGSANPAGSAKANRAITLGITVMTEADYEQMKLKRRKNP